MRRRWWTSLKEFSHSLGIPKTEDVENERLDGGDKGKSRDAISSPCTPTDDGTPLETSMTHAPEPVPHSKILSPELNFRGANIKLLS